MTFVGSDVPFQRRVLPEAKFEPVAVSVKAAPPAETVVGDMDESVGARMPLNPPQPDQNRTESNRKKWKRGLLITETSDLSP